MFKVQVMVSDDLLKRLDNLCDYIGSSRSSVCAAMIALSLPDWEKSHLPNGYQEVEEDAEQLKIE